MKIPSRRTNTTANRKEKEEENYTNTNKNENEKKKSILAARICETQIPKELPIISEAHKKLKRTNLVTFTYIPKIDKHASKVFWSMSDKVVVGLTVTAKKQNENVKDGQ